MSKPQKDLISLSVQFTILTSDQLKEIKFGLTKTKEADVAKWNIDFKLSGRAKKADAFEKIVEVTVQADLKDNALAEETAVKGLNKAQTDHLTLNAATAAERFNAGKIKEASFRRAVKATVPARNA